MQVRELARLDDAKLAELFRERRDDLSFLDVLNEELKHRDSDEALDLQIQVVTARRTFTRVAAPARAAVKPADTGPVRAWLSAFLQRRSLSRPDGRSFYRYRMEDDEYEKAKDILRFLARRGRLAQPDDRAGALFVAYCAEWFRRESHSTFLRWDDPAPDVFPKVPYPSKQQLTQRGLTYWRREMRMNGATRQFLLTVALEGGFPVRILADGARGWLKDYLRAIMRRAIAWRVDTRDEILAFAEDERGRVRKSYQHDDFVALCSELAASLLHLRQRAEAESAGSVRNSTLLDARYPGWRDELPIYVPPKDEALVAELLTGLLDEKMTGLVTEGVEARRYLVKRNGEWIPALQLLADGEVPSPRMPIQPAPGRFRAIATGELGNHFAGEVALLEPPIGEQRRWRVRPYSRTARLLLGFPFSSPVTTTLSAPDGAPKSWVWPRGEALRSEVLVFEQDEGSTRQEPLLRYFRSGSVSSPAKSLWVLVPHDWAVQPTIEGAVKDAEDVPALGCKLMRLEAAAYFLSGECDPVRFRVEPDSDARELELDLGRPPATGFLLADDSWELVESPLRPLICEPRKQPRLPLHGELFVRRPGGRWSQLSGALIGAGPIELSWRDPIANIQIEKRKLVLVPGQACMVGSMKDALSGDIQLRGLSGWSAAIREVDCAVDATDDSRLSIRFNGRPIYRLPMTLRPPEGQAFNVIVPLAGRDAVVALADGTILAPGRQIDIGALRGAVAVAPRRVVVHITAKGSRSGGVKMPVDGETPLGILRSAIDETLATLPGQDDLVELEILGDSRPPIRISRYRDGQLPRDGGVVRWHPAWSTTGVTPVARMILDPRNEHALVSDGDGAWRLPDRCKGPCLVYLRDGVDVVSRPVPMFPQGSPHAYSGTLISALAIPDYEERQRAIAEALAQLARGEAGPGDLTWLRDVSTSLNGLPASAFDALKLLPASPEALVHILLGARDAGERSLIWALQTELPFLWLALPLRAWSSALRGQSSALAHAMTGVLGREKAMNEAVTWLRGVCGELTALEPALETIFVMAGLPPIAPASDLPSLRDLTNSYIRDQHHRGGDAPNDLATRLASAGLRLPPEIETKSHTDFAGLFAPVLLAASAQSRLELDRELALIARRTLREDPIYVSAAWRHLVTFYGSKLT